MVMVSGSLGSVIVWNTQDVCLIPVLDAKLPMFVTAPTTLEYIMYIYIYVYIYVKSSFFQNVISAIPKNNNRACNVNAKVIDCVY